MIENDSENGRSAGADAPDATARSPTPGPDEAFCVECGEVIKEKAEICPECGVRQRVDGSAPAPAGPTDGPAAPATDAAVDLTERRRYELEEIASNDTATVVLAGIFLTPLAYWMVGKKALALVNFFTFNFFLLGPILVPVHCYVLMSNATEELRRAGVGGY